MMEQPNRILKGQYWKTRDGRCARIDADDYSGEYPFVGRVYNRFEEKWRPTGYTWRSGGEYNGVPDHPSDLVSLWNGPLPWVELPTQQIQSAKAYLRKMKDGSFSVRYFYDDSHLFHVAGDIFNAIPKAMIRAHWLDQPKDKP
jgi:hypothetical protein